MKTSSSSGSPRPTNARRAVLALATAMAAITYLDRSCLAALAPDISRDLRLDKDQMSEVYSAFALGYALFEIPTAWWADRAGTRKILSRIVTWWSFFTMVTAAAFNNASLLVARFLFGVGEAGAWPCVGRTFSRWLPARERGRAQGIFFAGAHLAGGVTPLLVLAIARLAGWRMVFVVLGVLGLGWVAIWRWWFRDEPAMHQGVNVAELELIQANRKPIPRAEGWKSYLQLARNTNVWFLCLGYIPNSCAFYFCITWFPTYLKERHGLESVQLGFFAGLPLMLSIAGDLLGGAATDFFSERFGQRVGRCGLSAAAYLFAGVAMVLAAFCQQGWSAALLISIAVAASMFMLGAAWAACLDIAGENAAVVSGIMNTSGQVASIACPLAVTALLEWSGNWNLPLFVLAGLFVVGAIGWGLVDPRKPAVVVDFPVG